MINRIRSTFSMLLIVACLLAACKGRPSIPAPILTAVPFFGPIPTFSHVWIITMENHESSDIIGSRAAPYINELASQYARAANYYGVRHPSLPNYIALTAGDTFTITSDCTTCYLGQGSIADQIEAAGRTWKAYLESMPRPCFVGNAAPLYLQKHDPFIYFDNIRSKPERCRNVVPLTQLEQDLAADTLPDYSWISPNMCNDMHDCSIGTGDAWLRQWVPRILASPAWQKDGVLFITFDEGRTNAACGSACCGLASGGQVVTLLISPLVQPGFVSNVAYSHYSLLRTVEESWGLPLLRNANRSCTAPMADFFKKP